MMNKYSAMLSILMTFWVVSSCGSSDGSGNRSTSYGTTPDGDRSNPATQNSSSTTTNNSTGSTSSGALAPYLFSLAEAEAISPLVQAYQAADSNDVPTQDPSLNSTRDFIAETLDDMMSLPPHAPGRDFTVTVIADNSPNASALNQSLVIHKGIIDFASNLSLALVICHEVAHSTRNHSSKSEKYMAEYEGKKSAQATKLDETLSALVASAYDKSTGKYNHKNSDYIRVKPIWDAFWSEFVQYQKRFESEADVVGARICANSGFSQEEVVNGFKSLFQLFKGLPKSTIKEGTYPVKEDEIGEFLHAVYGEDTHPTDEERAEQIDRIKSAFKQGSSTAISDRWKKSFPGKSSSLTSSNSEPTERPQHVPTKSIIIRRTQAAIDR